MATVKQDLIGLGFTPQLAFRQDEFTKVLYLKIKPDLADRMNLSGPAKVPTLNLPNQNKTLKAITGSVRFFLFNA